MLLLVMITASALCIRRVLLCTSTCVEAEKTCECECRRSKSASSNGVATKSVAVYSSVRVACRSKQAVITVMGTSQHKRTKIDRQCCNAMRCGRTDPFYKETQDAGRRARSRQGVENKYLRLCLLALCLWSWSRGGAS